MGDLFKGAVTMYLTISSVSRKTELPIQKASK